MSFFKNNRAVCWAADHWKNLRSHEKVNVVLTALIAFLTLVNVIATVVYVRTFTGSVKESGEQTDKLISVAMLQARAATDFAEAATNSSITAERTFRAEERPIIEVYDVGSPSWMDNSVEKGTGQVVWTYYFKNFGRVPTKDLTFHQHIKIGKGPFKPSFGSKDDGLIVVGPEVPGKTGDFNSMISGRMKKEDYLALLNQNESIQVRIVIEYTDPYGGKYETRVGLARLNMGSIEYLPGENFLQ
jgi:hypothetical protein